MSISLKPSLKTRFRRRLPRFLLLGAVAYVGIIAVLLAIESSLVFRPSSASESWSRAADPRTRDVWLSEVPGARLHSWWLPPERVEDGAILYFHGNGGNLSHRGKVAAKLRAVLGMGVLLVEYPGYGKSEGRPSEMGCYSAADAGYRWLIERTSISAQRIVIFGESIGGGPAVELAARVPHRSLVLLFTFTSLPAVAKYHFPWLPTYWLMRTRFDNLSRIEQCSAPIFIAHGTEDRVVPFRHGQELFDAAKTSKRFFSMQGFPHSIQLGEDFSWSSNDFSIAILRLTDRIFPLADFRGIDHAIALASSAG